MRDCLDGRRRADNGNLYEGTKVNAKTADYTVVAADRGKAFSNAGAAVTVTFALPSAAETGWWCDIFVEATQAVVLDPSGATEINDAATLTNGGVAGTAMAHILKGPTQFFATLTGTWS